MEFTILAEITNALRVVARVAHEPTRLRIAGTQLIGVNSTEIVRFDVAAGNARLRAFSHPRGARDSSPRFVDAMRYGTDRWLVVTRNSNDDPWQSGIGFTTHLAREVNQELEYLHAMDSQIRANNHQSAVRSFEGQSDFAGAVLQVSDNLATLRRCVDTKCLHIMPDSEPFNVLDQLAIDGDVLQRNVERCGPDGGCFAGRGGLIHLSDAVLPGTEETLHAECEPSPIVEPLSDCWLTLRERQSTVPLLRFGPEGDQQDPILFPVGSETAVAFRQGSRNRATMLTDVEPREVAFGDAVDFPNAPSNDNGVLLGTRHLADGHWADTASTAYEPFVERGAFRQVGRGHDPGQGLFLCNGELLHTNQPWMQPLAFRSLRTGRQTLVALQTLALRDINVVAFANRCALLFHDGRGTVLAPFVSTRTELLVESGISIYPTTAHYPIPAQFAVSTGDGFVWPGEDQPGNQGLAMVNGRGESTRLVVHDFTLPTDYRQTTGIPFRFPQARISNRQHLASDGRSLLLMRRVEHRVEGVRVDLEGNALWRGALLELSYAPEVEGERPTLGWTALLGVAPGRFVIAYQRFSSLHGAYRIYWRVIRFLDQA